MIGMIDSLTGVHLSVADNRVDEYLSAGYILADEIHDIGSLPEDKPEEIPEAVPEEKPKEKPKAKKSTKKK